MQDDAAVLTPVLVKCNELPRNGGAEMAQDRLVGGVNVECGGNEVEQRALG